MTQREGGERLDLPEPMELAGFFAGAAAALAVVTVPGLYVINGAQSAAEFNGVQSQVTMLIEQGKMTAKDGSPQPYIAKYKGQEFSVSVTSALLAQNGNFRDAGGQITQNSNTNVGNGAIQSQDYMSSYEVRGVIYRVKGSDNIFRPFFDDGGSRAFQGSWTGAKPVKAPLSVQPRIAGVQYVLPQANPAATPAPAPAPAPTQ